MNKIFKTHGKLSLFWRALRFWWQRRTRGWDDSVTWNLDQQLVVWLAPRLRRFKELNDGFPPGSTPASWDAELDEMIWAAEWYAENAYTNGSGCIEQDWDRANRGLKQMIVRLPNLWS